MFDFKDMNVFFVSHVFPEQSVFQKIPLCPILLIISEHREGADLFHHFIYSYFILLTASVMEAQLFDMQPRFSVLHPYLVLISAWNSEVKLGIASFLSDRIVDEILEALSRSQHTLVSVPSPHSYVRIFALPFFLTGSSPLSVFRRTIWSGRTSLWFIRSPRWRQRSWMR